MCRAGATPILTRTGSGQGRGKDNFAGELSMYNIIVGKTNK